MTDPTPRGYASVLAEAGAIVARHAKAPVTEDTHLIRDLDLDSLDVAELIAEIEDHFSVIIPMDVLPELRTVGDTARCLVGLMDGTAVRQRA